MSDLETNLGKLTGYLARFKEDGILNQIGGEACPATSGATFETRSPVDESLICQVAKGRCRRHRCGGQGSEGGLSRLARHGRHGAQEDPAQDCRRHRRAGRGNRAVRMLGHRPGTALHVEGRSARRRKFPLLRRQGTGCTGRPGAALADPDEHHHPGAHRPGRRDHARGTRRSCCPPGRSPRRWPPAAPWCTSRRSSRR